jgi:NAD(P)-dependent dehydrogenase (short-subunit alcohol dehydrogenase family)
VRKNPFELTSKVALVTGAGRGIGRACALALAQAGADVALVARSRPELEAVAAEIGRMGQNAFVRPQDVTRVEQLPEVMEEIASHLGGIDILVNNAGMNIPQEALEVTPEAWDRVVDLNLRAAFFTAQAAGRVMVRQGRGGRIINLTSQTGSVGLLKRSAYCASKGALNLVTKVLALEWAPHNILVNAVAPTFIETEFSRGFLSDPGFREYALSKNLLKRFGTPEDVTGAVVYLASAAASLVTGSILFVDAGWTAH